jgi:hypothetical protein
MNKSDLWESCIQWPIVSPFSVIKSYVQMLVSLIVAM